MDSDTNKKKDQNPKKSAIKIKQINIPENIRALLNRGEGAAAGAAGAAAASGGLQAGKAAASSLSALDPFIKVVADSNRGIILMAGFLPFCSPFLFGSESI